MLMHPTVGNPAFMSDESKELTLRVHDECSSFDLSVLAYSLNLL